MKALEFAKSLKTVLRVEPQVSGGWLAECPRCHTPGAGLSLAFNQMGEDLVVRCYGGCGDVELVDALYIPGDGVDVLPANQWVDREASKGHDRAYLQEKLSKTLPFPGSHHAEDEAIAVEDLLVEPIPVRKQLLAPWLLEESLWMIHAKPGIGKTWFCLGVAHAVATGGSFLKWKAEEPRRVLYVDGEMGRRDMPDRLRTTTSTSPLPLERRLKILSGARRTGGEIPDLCTKEGQDLIEKNLEGVALVVFDNIGCLWRTGAENEAESWTEAQQWLNKLRARGLAIMNVHHSGKNGTQHGTSKRERACNGILRLEVPQGYRADEEGCRFVIHCEKARDLVGADRPELEACLTKDEQGAAVWTWCSAKNAKTQSILDLAEEGYGVTEIAKKVGCDKGYVSRLLKKKREAQTRVLTVDSPYRGEESTTTPARVSGSTQPVNTQSTAEPKTLEKSRVPPLAVVNSAVNTQSTSQSTEMLTTPPQNPGLVNERSTAGQQSVNSRSTAGQRPRSTAPTSAFGSSLAVSNQLPPKSTPSSSALGSWMKELLSSGEGEEAAE